MRLGILWRGRQLGLLNRYPIFFCFVAFSLFSDVILWSMQFSMGMTERAEKILYRNVYIVVDLLALLLVIALLADFYTRFKSQRDRAAWVGLAAFTLIMVWSFSGQQANSIGGLYLVAKSTLLHFAVLFALVAVGQLLVNRRCLIGVTDFLIVLGLGVNVAGQYLGWTLVTLRLAEYNTFKPWIVPLGFAPWLIWALAVRRFVPTTELSRSYLDAARRSETEFAKAVRLLLRRT